MRRCTCVLCVDGCQRVRRCTCVLCVDGCQRVRRCTCMLCLDGCRRVRRCTCVLCVDGCQRKLCTHVLCVGGCQRVLCTRVLCVGGCQRVRRCTCVLCVDGCRRVRRCTCVLCVDGCQHVLSTRVLCVGGCRRVRHCSLSVRIYGSTWSLTMTLSRHCWCSSTLPVSPCSCLYSCAALSSTHSQTSSTSSGFTRLVHFILFTLAPWYWHFQNQNVLESTQFFFWNQYLTIVHKRVSTTLTCLQKGNNFCDVCVEVFAEMKDKD